MRGMIFLFFAAALFMHGTHAFADGSDDEKNNEKDGTGAIREYFGKVMYSRSLVIAFEEKGRLAYVAPEGTLAAATIYDLRGTPVRQGTLLAMQDTEIAGTKLRIAEMRLRDTGAVISERKLAYDRDKRLSEKSAVSTKQYLETQLAYERALIDGKKAELEVVQARRVLDACSIRAPFNGIVEQVYASTGTAVDVAGAVMRFSILSPMKIVVDIPQDVSAVIDRTTGVTVYPVDSEEGYPAWFYSSRVGAKQLECYVENPLVPVGRLSPAEMKYPEIDGLFPAYPDALAGQTGVVWINSGVIKHDGGDRYYVWRLKGVRSLERGYPVKRMCVVEKLLVQPLDMEFTGSTFRMRGIKCAERISNQDVFVGSVPKDVESGDTVVYRAKRRRFRSGETVRVVFRSSNVK